MCEAYYREKAGLSSGGSGLKYPMWNVERSSLSTDKANMQWSVTLVHQVYKRFLWWNMLWTVQGLDLGGIRIDSAGVWNVSLKWAVVLHMQAAAGSFLVPRVPGRSVPVSQVNPVLHSAFHTSQGRAGFSEGSISCSSVHRKLQYLEHELLL